MNTSLLRDIKLTEESWRSKLFVTTDIDWACDEVIQECYNFFNKYNIKATWFVTHNSKLNQVIFNDTRHAIGCHPNFNNLLFSNSNNETAEIVLNKLLNDIPKTEIIRCHSVVNSSQLLDLFYRCNLKIESNLFIPILSNLIAKPFLHYNGIIRVPYVWSDDVHLLYKWDYKIVKEKILNYDGIAVIDCHPIHIFLNTEKTQRYIDAKPFLNNFNLLKKFVNNKSYGTRDFLRDLFR